MKAAVAGVMGVIRSMYWKSRPRTLGSSGTFPMPSDTGFPVTPFTLVVALSFWFASSHAMWT